MIKIKRGLDLPLAGEPDPSTIRECMPAQVAVLGPDYHGMRPTINVEVGQKVKKGQQLFIDKKNEGVVFTAPAAGTIHSINRGHKRALLSIVIDVAGDESEHFGPIGDDIEAAGPDEIQGLLVRSGLWTAIRTRPFSRIPTPASLHSAPPRSIFVTAIDTNPLAADPADLLRDRVDDFQNGVRALARMAGVPVHVCVAPSWPYTRLSHPQVHYQVFSGPHPAGLPGTHIHFVDPVSASRQVWQVGCQDVAAIGKLVTTGELDSTRVVALGGPQVQNPGLVRTLLGASLDEMTAGQLVDGDNRVVSGSALAGFRALGPLAFLGRYHSQVTVLREGREQKFLGWLTPGTDKHSSLNIYLSRLFPKKKLALSTAVNGSARAMVPMGTYEKVMPMDILPTMLLRALIVGDTDSAQELGCLELDEEDLGLCTYVCPGKYEYGRILRDNLTRIEKEG